MDRFRIMTSFICRLVIVISVLIPGAVAAAPDYSLLDRAGTSVEQFWSEMSSVTCTETISQEKFNEKGKVVLNHQAAFDYLIALRWNGGEMLVDESRIEINPGRKKAAESALLATSGFATLLLILHPEFQPGYHFEPQPEELLDGRRLLPFHFIPKAGGRSPGALELKGRDYPIAWEGTVWIDPASAMVARIEAHWSDPPQEIGLASLVSDVKYSPISLRSKTYWLPQEAEIEVKTPHQRWHNVHRFSGYRLFAVETDVQTLAPEEKK